MGLEGIAVSNGSACTAASIDPSHVLLAMGLNETEAFSCLRFSLGRFNTEADVAGHGRRHQGRCGGVAGIGGLDTNLKIWD